jgi:hypothetical protein
MESNIIPASWGAGDLHSCILRGRCKSAFLHPKEEIQGLLDLPQGWWSKCSQDYSLPPIKVQNTPVHLRKPEKSMANEKPPPHPRVKTSIKPQPSPEQQVTSFWALLHFSSCSLSFLANKSHFIHRLWLIIQLLHEPVPWPVKARTLGASLQHFKPAHNNIFIGHLYFFFCKLSV